MTVTVSFLDAPPRAFPGCDATINAGVLSVLKRASAPSEHYPGTVVDKAVPVCYYAPGTWTSCEFEETSL